MLLLALGGAVGLMNGEVAEEGPRRELVGRVVDDTGAALPRARVRVAGSPTGVTTDGQGVFRLVVPDRPLLVTGEAEGHLPRTQAAEPGVPTLLRLTGQAATTVSLRFGGDTMFGRRFYDRDENGDRADALLPERASVAQHAALLEQVTPLLADADLTVVNLESTVLDEPWFDPTGRRPVAFHEKKEFVFASAPPAVGALATSGVDVVSLGNNHINDALDPGLARTLEVLDEAGLPHFGAGRTVDEAWTPAVVERRGQTFAFLACTTITGTQHEISYVAEESHGGAARCTTERLRREVERGRAFADTVVVMLHGGEEYEVEQTQLVRQLTSVALQAGASLAVNGHPHVVGGETGDERGLVAESMGNLLFDQTVWPTFLSYLLRVDVRAGTPVLTTVDPLLLQDYVPRPTVGLLADAAARKAAGLLPGSTLLQPPAAVVPPAATPAAAVVRESLPTGSVARLAPGRWLRTPVSRRAEGGGAGEDLLWWTGSFEDMDTDPGTRGAHMWALGPNARLDDRAACSGRVGASLQRSPVSTQDVVVTPRHRQLVRPGTRLSLLADVRDASPGSTLELRWYRDTQGPSSSGLSVEIPEPAPEECLPVRLDAVVPEGVVAAQPYVRLAPTGDVHLAAHLAVDDVRLVAWGPPGATGRLFDSVIADEDVTLEIADDAGTAGAGGGGGSFSDVSTPVR